MPLVALDLFCGAGGVATGLQRAGFDVVGVDIAPQPRYRGGTFIQEDALTFPLDGYDLIWASPPCQAHTNMSNRWRGKGGRADEHVSLIAAIRERLIASGAPFVIENVVGARRHLQNPLLLSGGHFGLGVHRPRLFEASFLLPCLPSARPPQDIVGVYGKHHDGRRLWPRTGPVKLRAAKSLSEARSAMGIDWMEWRELCEAVPPAYAEWIGCRFVELRALTRS